MHEAFSNPMILEQIYTASKRTHEGKVDSVIYGFSMSALVTVDKLRFSTRTENFSECLA